MSKVEIETKTIIIYNNKEYELKELLEGLTNGCIKYKNIIKEAREYLKENACYDVDMQEFCRDLIYDKCLELLNILDKVDKDE